MKIGVSGSGLAGKDVVCEILRDKCGVNFTGSTSWHAKRVVWEKWGRYHYNSIDECYDNRRENRMTWRQIILDYNGESGCELYREIMQDSDILQGIRDDRELAACKRERLVDIWIWVDRPGVPVDPTLKYGPEECNYVLKNDGDIGQLVERTVALYEFLSSIPASPALADG